VLVHNSWGLSPPHSDPGLDWCWIACGLMKAILPQKSYRETKKPKILIGLIFLIAFILFCVFMAFKTTAFEVEGVGIGPSLPVVENPQIELPITAYSELDSCHYSGCPMANGIKAKIGYVACPRQWKLGTKIEVEGMGTFECGDRYRKDLSDRIDVFMGYGEEAHQKAIEFGKQIKSVEIIITFNN